MRIEWKSCFRVFFSAFLLFLAIYYWSGVTSFAQVLLQAALPLILGAIIAYIVNILMSFYERKIRIRHKLWEKLRRITCMSLAFLTVILGVALLTRLIIPQLLSCFQVLFAALPQALESLFAWLERTFNLSSAFTGESMPQNAADWSLLIKKYANVLVNGVGGAMNVVITTATSLVGGVITAFMSLIFSVYILTGKEKLIDQFHRLTGKLLGEERSRVMNGAIHVLNDCFHNYIVGQCLEGIILGALCTLGMTLLRLPYALMIGALVGVTALIPVAGAYIGAAVGAVMIFSVSPVKALIFVIFLVILQQLEGNLIYPRTVGSSLGLPGIWVLAAVTIGGGVLGVAGMLFFVPLAAAVYKLLGMYVRGEKLGA